MHQHSFSFEYISLFPLSLITGGKNTVVTSNRRTKLKFMLNYCSPPRSCHYVICTGTHEISGLPILRMVYVNHCSATPFLSHLVKRLVIRICVVFMAFKTNLGAASSYNEVVLSSAHDMLLFCIMKV